MNTPFDARRRGLLRAALSAASLGPVATLSLAATSAPGPGPLRARHPARRHGRPVRRARRGRPGVRRGPRPAGAVRLGPAAAGRAPSRCTRTSCSCTRCTAAARCRCCTPSACPTASARTSMRRTCSSPAATGPSRSPPAGWAARSAPGRRAASRWPPRCRWCCAGRARSTPGRRRRCPIPSADLVARLERLYGSDPALANALARAKALHFDAGMMAEVNAPKACDGRRCAAGRLRDAGAACGASSCRTAGGPRAAVLELGGWDSHANEAAPQGATANALRVLDSGLAALRDGLPAGGVWRDTVVVVATEFGREVAVNGTQGTDHGSAGAAFVLGGPVKGGRVLADWPGLAGKDRFEGRDLRTTTDLRALLKGVLADHLQVARRAARGRGVPGQRRGARAAGARLSCAGPIRPWQPPCAPAPRWPSRNRRRRSRR